ncbi:unnamed protein product, partial [Schistosoma bovis]
MSYDGEPDGIPSSFVKYGSREFPLFCLKLSIYLWNMRSIHLYEKHLLPPPDSRWGHVVILLTIVPLIGHALSRTIEKDIHKQLLPSLLSASLISLSQHGFMTKRSCFTSHQEFFDQITQRREVGQL